MLNKPYFKKTWNQGQACKINISWVAKVWAQIRLEVIFLDYGSSGLDTQKLKLILGPNIVGSIHLYSSCLIHLILYPVVLTSEGNFTPWPPSPPFISTWNRFLVFGCGWVTHWLRSWEMLLTPIWSNKTTYFVVFSSGLRCTAFAKSFLLEH